MNQEELVLDYLQKGGVINKTIAMEEFGILHLNTKIFRLRDEGFNIDKEMKIDEASGKKIAHYFLKDGRG